MTALYLNINSDISTATATSSSHLGLVSTIRTDHASIMLAFASLFDDGALDIDDLIHLLAQQFQRYDADSLQPRMQQLIDAFTTEQENSTTM